MAQTITGLLPDAVAAKVTEKAAVDRLSALLDCIDTVRRGGTVSISGVYGGQLDPLPMMKIFDKGLQLRMCQAHVRQWGDQGRAEALSLPSPARDSRRRRSSASECPATLILRPA
jgi:threonine dehydrogenase-like Zn-dependent dehydrogenase